MSGTVVTTVFLMLALGVRHGCDPEHLAIVNSVTLQAAERGRRWPAASGLYFALGHGLVITLVALGVVGLLDAVHLPGWLLTLAQWLPAAILLVVAVVNLRELLRDRLDYRPVAVKQRLLPRAINDSSSPLAVFTIGMLFAPFVDPAAQAAVWGYAVTATGTVAGHAVWVLGLGVVLTLAMAVTCVLEARAVVLLMHATDASRAARRRRAVGWVIVVFSFAVFGYSIAAAVCPADMSWMLRALAGVGTGAAVAALCVAVLLRHDRRAGPGGSGDRAQKGMSSSSKPPSSPVGAGAGASSRPPPRPLDEAGAP